MFDYFKVQLKQHQFNGGPESENRYVMTIVYIIPRVYMRTMKSKHLNKVQTSKIYTINQILRSKDDSFLCMCHDQKEKKSRRRVWFHIQTSFHKTLEGNP